MNFIENRYKMFVGIHWPKEDDQEMVAINNRKAEETVLITAKA